MSDRVRALLEACRVPPGLSPAAAGPWSIESFDLPHSFRDAERAPIVLKLAPFVSYTALFRATLATLHHERGEVVMEDSGQELRRHLPILLEARGRVLVTGLGLGCVLRGLLSKPEVEHVDVVEIDPWIVGLIWPEFAGSGRATLHKGDAMGLQWPPGSRWDFAWHDVWTEDGSLQTLHAELLARYHGLVGQQGAWGFPRPAKRRWPVRLLGEARA